VSRAAAFVISDTHFGQATAITKWRRPDGDPVRPFASVEEMDEVMVQRWNAVVRHGDTVYHLGDVAMSRPQLKVLRRLNGRKILIRGNHDMCKLRTYAEYFSDVRAMKIYPEHGLVLTHIPIHPQSLTERWRLNIHGHLHLNKVLDADGSPDPRYRCVSVEQVDYTPLPMEQFFV
jgi:calcineurin-like phosphoesterase family protein